MGRELYRNEPVFREAVDHCRALLQDLGAADVLPAFLASSGDKEVAQAIQPPSHSGLCIFVYQHAVCCLLAKLGVSPDVVLGHSLGEYACAVTSGALPLKDALAVLHIRGVLLERLEHPGAMLLVAAAKHAVTELLDEETAIVAFNGPDSNGVAGPIASIDALARRFDAKGISYRRIRYGAASHCRLVEPLLPEFEVVVSGLSLRAPKTAWISTVTADYQPENVVVDTAYWRRQFREPVRFAEAVQRVASEGPVLFVEIGPHNGLANLVSSNLAVPSIVTIGQHASDRRDSRLALRQGIEALRGHGVNVTGETLSYAEAPTIANSSSAPARVVQSGAPIARRPLSDVEFVIRAIWQEMFAITEVGLDSNFFDLGGHSLLAVRINSEIRSLLLLDLPISVQFEYPTLRGMAIALAAAGQAHGVDVAAIAATLREVSEMSDEELLVASG
jgi:acyl transferase domain-containing protein